MTLSILLIAFVVGIATAFVPLAKTLTQYFDTIVHEVGHGLATLPFGASLPAITLNKDFSGETRSSLGQIHSILPRGIGIITGKIARFFSLIAGYSAPIILASFLMVLAYLSGNSKYLEVNEWVILSLALICLSTLLWTIVAATDSPVLFFLASAGIVAAGWFFFDMGVYSFLLLLVVGIIFFFGKYLFSFIALITTIISIISTVLMITGVRWVFGDFSTDVEKGIELIFVNHSVDPGLIALLVFSVIGIVAFLSAKTFLSLGLITMIMGSVIGTTIVSMLLNNSFALSGYTLGNNPLLATPFLLAFLSGCLFASGAKSFYELKKITFPKETPTSKIYGHDTVETDVVFAADELGGTKEFWFIFLSVITVLASIWIILIPFGIFV